jgi:hypothetical protein
MAQRKAPRKREEGFGWETPYDVYHAIFSTLPSLRGRLYFYQEESPQTSHVSYHFEYHLFPPKGTPAGIENIRATLKFTHLDFLARSAQSIADEFIAKVRNGAKAQGVEI